MILPCFDQSRITLYQGDCLDVLPSLDVHDLAFFDPPYNCGKNYGTDKDNRPDYDEWTVKVCEQIRRVAKNFAVVLPNRRPGLWMHCLPGGWPVAMKIRAGNAIRNGWENKVVLLWTDIEPEKRQPNYWKD